MDVFLNSELTKVIAVPSDVQSLRFDDLKLLLHSTEAAGQSWSEGWGEFFWRIGEDKELWHKYKDETWVQPGIKDAYSGPHQEVQWAACSVRFPSLGHISGSHVCMSGNVRLLAYLHSHQRLHWEPEASTYAAQFGHILILEFCIAHNLFLSPKTAHECRNLETLIFCRHSAKIQWDPVQIGEAAARRGDLVILESLFKWHHQWSSTWCKFAVAGDHVEIVDYAINNNLHLPWDPEFPVCAIENGNLKMLQKYVIHQGNWQGPYLYLVIESGHLNLWKFALNQNFHLLLIPSIILLKICTLGLIDHLKEWVLSRNLPLGAKEPLFCAAAVEGHYSVVDFLWEPDMFVSHETTCEIARRGHLNILQFLVNHGVSCSPFITLCAATYKRYDILDFWIHRGLYWHPHTPQ